MKKFTYFFLLFFIPTFLTAKDANTGHLFLQLKKMANHQWGVFVSADNSVTPSPLTRTGTGQVTIVAPAGFTYYSFKNHGGTWVENARVTNPDEAAGKAYISFGFVMDSPKISIQPTEETLLFSFAIDAIYENQIQLFENGIDPFETPNSYGSNPGNDLGMIDKTKNNEIIYYTYEANIFNPTLISENSDEYYEQKKPVATLVSHTTEEDEK